MQQIDDALEAYQQAFRLDSNSTDVIYNLGALRDNRGAIISQKLSAMSAEDNYKNAAADEPRMRAALAAAQPYLEMLQRRQPNDIPTLSALATIYQATGQTEKANRINALIGRAQ